MDNNWSIETVQETAANNWSLEGDNQLLNLMKSISKNLEQRCMTSNNNLNRLMLDVDKTKIKLGNATTKLLDLSNGKFVEHTVMDMDVPVVNTEKGTPAENEKAFVSLPKAVEEAVTNGLNMMDRCYEKVLLNLEDSDDEEENDSGQKHVVCRPKDPYLNRPLPHLIGSKQWNDKWHVGLIESDEEVLSDEEPQEFSQSSSDEGDSLSNSPRTSNPPTTSESDFTVPAPAVNHHEDLFHRLSDDGETKSPLFAPDDNKYHERVKVLPTVKPSIQGHVSSEPVNKPKQLTEPPVPVLEQPKQSIFVQQKTEPKFLNLFDDEPPSLEEPIRHERKPVNLFLDSDDEDDRPTNDAQKPSSIFNNNNDKLPNRPTLPFSIPQTENVPKVDKTKSDVANNNVPAVAKNEIKPTLKSADFGGLFDDEPPDDFFDIIVREQKGKSDVNRNAETSKLQSKTVNLFDSDDDDDDFSRIIGTTTKKDSTGSVISSKESAPVVKQDASYSPFNSPFRSPKNNDPPKSYVSFLDDEPVVEDVKHETAASHQSSSRTNLFDDTPPDDIFVSKQKSPTKIIYDDIASTLLEASPSTANLSSNSLRSETSDDVRVEAPPVILPRKPELKVVPDDVVVKAKTIATEQTPSAEPKSDTSSDDVHVEAPPVILPRKPELKVIPDDVVVKSKAAATNKTPVLSAQSKSDANSRDETDQTDQSLSFRKNLSMFSNPVATALPNVDKETKPKPNKLKTNFNINVAALLPGAKLPSQKQSAAEKPDRTVEPDREAEEIGNVNKDNVTSVSNVKHISSGEDSSGRLVCLGRDRPRIQVQRKPSTRTGRKKLYNKTQVSEDDNVVSSVEATDSVTPEIETKEQDIQSAEPLEAFPKSDAQGTYQDQDSLSESLTYDEPPPLESNEPNSNVVVDDDEEDWLKNIDEKPPSPSKTNLYDEDWLSTKPVNEAPKSSTQNMSHVMNYDWLTASSLPPEDINPPSNYSIDDDHEQDDWLSSYVTKERSSVVADLPNDDDWLITAQETSRGTVAGANSKDGEEVEKDWLLQATLESEKNISKTADDDDWLTESLAPPKVHTKATNDEVPVSYAINKITTDRQDDGSNAVESIAEPRQTIRSGLFDSDDENTATDELVGSKLDVGRNSSDVFESKVETKIIRSSTIFDDDDDVTVTVPSYLSKESKSDASKQTPPKINVTGGSSNTIKPTTETKKSINSTLFDDDDDDDLFASVKPKASLAKQPTTAAVKTAKNVSIKTAAKSSLFSDDDNSDPDDLFGTTTTTTKKQKGKIEAGHKSKMDKPKKTSLFDDEDDDDEDIFAPKAQKQQRVTQTDAKKKSSVTKSVTTIPASSDPLADLLK